MLLVLAEYAININKFQFSMDVLPDILRSEYALVYTPFRIVPQFDCQRPINKCSCQVVGKAINLGLEDA